MQTPDFSRRNFLKTSSLALAGLATQDLHFLDSRKVKHLGVQLYSVRDDMFKDPKGTIETVARMGYREVEAFGHGDSKLFGLGYRDFGKLLKTNGLKMPSSHIMVTLKDYNTKTKDISDAIKRTYDEAAALGQKYVICPWMNQEERDKIADLIPAYAAANRYAKKAGVQFAYHNHDFEFLVKGPDGRSMYRWILEELDVPMEMDIYWVHFANEKPLDWFQKYPGRFHLCHAKDLAKTAKRETVEVGDGSIDFAGVFSHRKLAGMKYFVVELEHYKTTPLEGIKKSREGFLKLKF
jgi:sugar phosphate isomerase/epimerase